ncbi:MAG: hypothetical protein JO359_13065 [Candidatus Eremiobacteraeota bacterium]|nr:hypothetical protein [Candidatus Eremiobacteraeota bacterium]
MKRFADAEILGLYVPRGLSSPVAPGEQVACVRAHCSRPEYKPGTRAHRWTPRFSKQPVIELCPNCHRELETMIAGG